MVVNVSVVLTHRDYILCVRQNSCQKKTINITAKQIISSDVLITWSLPVDNDLLIAGYKIFYDIDKGIRLIEKRLD